MRSQSPQSVRFGVRSRKLSNVGQSLDEGPKMYYHVVLRASVGTLSCWSQLHLQSLAPINPHWAHVVDYGPLSLFVIHKEGLCPSSGDINWLMMKIDGLLSTCAYHILLSPMISQKATKEIIPETQCDQSAKYELASRNTTRSILANNACGHFSDTFRWQ
jgi:hypothetical protein